MHVIVHVMFMRYACYFLNMHVTYILEVHDGMYMHNIIILILHLSVSPGGHGKGI